MVTLRADGNKVNGDSYGPWMLVERRKQRQTRDVLKSNEKNLAEFKEGSRFEILATRKELTDQEQVNLETEQGNRSKKGKEINFPKSPMRVVYFGFTNNKNVDNSHKTPMTQPIPQVKPILKGENNFNLMLKAHNGMLRYVGCHHRR